MAVTISIKPRWDDANSYPDAVDFVITDRTVTIQVEMYGDPDIDGHCQRVERELQFDVMDFLKLLYWIKGV